MENKRLQLLQGFIGKPFSGSPSPFAKWQEWYYFLIITSIHSLKEQYIKV